ncbi:MAG: ParB N-terminal domain-containing protein [Patescibacteria group bacterium]|nr:ParB N-terminal domain-containing protein [Patescibacteria group bacterium]
MSSLRPASYNPRKWDAAAIAGLTASIKEFGLVDPIIVNAAESRKNIVVGGHFRLKIAKDLGYKTVPVVYVDIPDERKERELNLRLNKNLGDWDWTALAEFDQDLLKDVGFESDELDRIFDLDLGEDDFDADAEAAKIGEPQSQYGEVYQLGRHRLMCGDSTKREDVDKLMDGTKADMVFTDPPYNVNYGMTMKDKLRHKVSKENAERQLCG